MNNIIYQTIRTDVPLRKKIANYLDITDASVYNCAKRKAPRLKEYGVVRIIMAHTGKTEKEVFEQETTSTQSR